MEKRTLIRFEGTQAGTRFLGLLWCSSLSLPAGCLACLSIRDSSLPSCLPAVGPSSQPRLDRPTERGEAPK